MAEWKSSVLTCFEGDDHCAICRFIARKDKPSDVLEVIRVLDKKLHEAEQAERRLLSVIQRLRSKEDVG